MRNEFQMQMGVAHTPRMPYAVWLMPFAAHSSQLTVLGGVIYVN